MLMNCPRMVKNGPSTKSARGSAPVGVERADTTTTGLDRSGAIPSAAGDVEPMTWT
jgi:hypothetical protein